MKRVVQHMTEQDEYEAKRIKEPLTSLDSSLTRRCHYCGGAMSATARESDADVLPSSEKGIRFTCEKCENSIWIASNDTIILAIASGLLIALGISYMLSNGLISFIGMGFESGGLWSLLSLLLIALVVIFAIGGWLNFQRGLGLCIDKKKHPLLTTSEHPKGTFITLLLGLLPWLLVMGTGYINYTYFDDSSVLGVLGVALFALPMAFAKKLGSSTREVFFAMIMWFILGGAAAWIYNIW